VNAQTPSTKRIVAEGLLIALSAVRMAVKNRIIIGALREHRDYDQAEYAAIAQHELHLLALQNTDTARRVGRLRRALANVRWTESLSEDQRLDLRQLTRRRRVHRRLAVALHEVAADDAQVARLVEQAQADASQEIGRALSARLIAQDVDRREPDYEKRRADRARDLVSIDLAALRSDKSTPSAAEAEH
jgi:hypothetical protein